MSELLCLYLNSMTKFDKQLELYSHRFTLIRILKNQLSTSANEIYKTIMMSDKQDKGYFTAKQIQRLWMQETNGDQSVVKLFIAYYFPVEKISYSLLSRFLCFGQASQQVEKLEAKRIQNHQKHIKEIFNLELANYATYCFLNQQITAIVPCIGSKPTRNEFQDYVICKQLVVNLQAVSKALFLAQISPPMPPPCSSTKFQTDLSQPSVQNIQKIMQRLKNKVTAFGNEWLN